MVSLLGKCSQFSPEQVIHDDEEEKEDDDEVSFSSASNEQHITPFWWANG